ncbi:MAG TPA: hypothetical protein VLA05_07785 [Coriobacteriia bacterium]|nr:hypothetical protein [Coriobacteriia bacterium]
MTAIDQTAAELPVPRAKAGVESEEPLILDTYSTVYAFILLFLVPGVLAMSRLPFGDDRSRIYTFEYVSLVTMPFVLGLILTFLIDSRDSWKRVALRIAVLTPLIVLTGVTLMFGVSMVMIPASTLLGIREQGLSIMFWAGLALVAAPLVVSFVRRLKRPDGWRWALQMTAIAATLALVVGVFIVSLVTKTDIYEIWRKDVVIYVIGALTWYLPSFGLAAGFWRRTGLV